MPAHPIDFDIQANLFSTSEGLAIFDEKNRFQRWLDFEAALAAAQGELGIIPPEAAATIQAKCRIELLDLDAVRHNYTTNRNSLVPIVNALRQACKPHGDYVHHGATTQDAIDTGQALELKAVFSLITRDLRQIEDRLLELAAQHRALPMIGRTHSQQAIPISLGLKVSIWLLEMNRHADRLQALCTRALTGQLGGAVGTMAALGPQGREIAALTMAKLGLRASTAPWHTSRDNSAETGSFFAMLTSSAAKIANEIFQLGKTEVMELREPAPAGKTAGSSTMPHKRNPVLCQRIVVLSSHVRAMSQVLMEAMLHENERDPRALWSEWLAMPQSCIYTLTALDYLKSILFDVEILPERMMANLRLQQEAIASEWLMFTLTPLLGKASAHATISQCLDLAATSGQSLREILSKRPELRECLKGVDLTMLDQPESYIGLAPQIVDDVIQQINQKRNG
ncbi:MAG: adenylosuccinate lyase family protein [Desulfobulbaceae bacterium]|nr:adenylosuccinate lyase family protein [Desulfobulbaceae bacterium]